MVIRSSDLDALGFAVFQTATGKCRHPSLRAGDYASQRAAVRLGWKQ